MANYRSFEKPQFKFEFELKCLPFYMTNNENSYTSLLSGTFAGMFSKFIECLFDNLHS